MTGGGRTWGAAWRSALANRAGFWSQMVIMAVNDAVWIVFWVLFFRQVGSMRGWDIDRLIVLFAVITTSAGIVLGAFNNTRRIGELIVDGGLDAALTLPVRALPHLLVRRIESVNVGDSCFGVLLFVMLGDPTPTRAAVFVFGVVTSVLLMGSFLVLVGSIRFFIDRSEAGELGFHAVLLFSSYPVDIFGGGAKLFLYLVVPAGFISSVPAILVDDFQWRWALASVAVTAMFVSGALISFHTGLRRHVSGSAWT